MKCATCRKNKAQWRALHKTTGEKWVVCNSCRRQAYRFGCPIVHVPLDEMEEAG